MSKESRYDSMFQYYAQEYDIPDWRWLKAQAKIESQFNPDARSPVGAMGLTQFMPATWEEWAPGKDPFNPEHSIRAQAAYMKWLLERFDGVMDNALAAYNWGIGNVRRAMKKHMGDWRPEAPSETKNYVSMIKVLHNGYTNKPLRA